MAQLRDAPSSTLRFHASRGILLTQALRFGVRLGTTAGLARLLAPTDYGVFGMAALIHGFAYVVQDFGLAAMTLRKPSLSPDERTALFWLNLGWSVILASVVVATGPAAAALFHQPLLRLLIPVLALTLILNGLHAQLRAQLGREQRFAELNRIEIAAFIVSSLVALLAASLGAGCWALVMLAVTAEGCIMVGVWRAQPWRPGRWPRGFSLSSPFSFGLGTSGHEVLRFLLRHADQFFIGRWFGAEMLGWYGRAVQLVMLPGMYLIDPLATWAISTLGSLHLSSDARGYWRRLVNGLTHLTTPVAVFLFFLSTEVLRICFGPGWEQGAPLLRGLSLSLLVQPLLAGETWALIASGYVRRLLSWSAVSFTTAFVVYLATRNSRPQILAYAVSGVLLTAGVAGLIVLRGSPITLRDAVQAMVRPLLLAIVAASALSVLLPLVSPSAIAVRVSLGASVIAVTWSIAWHFWPAARAELQSHFLRR